MEEVELKAVCDKNEAAAANLAKKFLIHQYYSKIEDLLIIEPILFAINLLAISKNSNLGSILLPVSKYILLDFPMRCCLSQN